jgi:hypothetical protein
MAQPAVRKATCGASRPDGRSYNVSLSAEVDPKVLRLTEGGFRPNFYGEDKAKQMSAAPLIAHALDDPDPPIAERKHALEALLRARRLAREAPPLRGEDRRLRPLPTAIATIDDLLGGGLPRGQLSQVHGPVSSGRTGVLVSLLASVTSTGALAALVDPLDRFDPASAAAAGADLTRLLWLRGPHHFEEPTAKALADATAAAATLAGSGLFDLVALDLAGAGTAWRALPSTTWLRLARLVEETPTALLVLADARLAQSPGGASIALVAGGVRWSAPVGPGCRLVSLAARARAGRHGLRGADLALAAPA